MFGAEFPQRRLYARVARAEQIGTGPYARHSYEFDAVDVEVSSGGRFEPLFDADDQRHFALVRVVTTEGLFDRTFGTVPQPGYWFALDIGPKGGGPITFHAQLTGTGYSVMSRGTLQSATFLFADEDLGGGPDRGPDGDGGGRGGGLLPDALRLTEDRVPVVEVEIDGFASIRRGTGKEQEKGRIKVGLRSLGAAASVDIDAAKALANECEFPQGALTQAGDIQTVLASKPSPHAISINDVGQASFATLLDDKQRPLVYFDAGWPVVFNGKTAPKSPPSLSSGTPVIVSHWDFDHISGFFRFPELGQAPWIAPVQRLGPGARKIAAALAGRNLLMGWSGSSIALPWGELVKCSGLPKMVNHSGLALIVLLDSGKKALLAGDANYESINLPNTSFSYLAVTHHGAHFEGSVPTPIAGGALGIISVGRGNVYGHPKAASIAKHTRAQWLLDRTAGTRKKRRGDRTFGP